MSNTYSMGGYRLALLIKTNKTIIVEGRDDKDLFVRYKCECPQGCGFDIDTSDIISDDALSGLGAKAKIDAFLEGLGPQDPARAKLRAFVDREWERMVDEHTNDPLPWAPLTGSEFRITTSGHSLENYGFSSAFVISYLRHFGEGIANEILIKRVEELFPSLVQFAAAVSEVARRRSIIKRCKDMFDIDDIFISGNRFYLNANFSVKLGGRGVVDASTFVSEVRSSYENRWISTPYCDEAKYHVHGHLGEDIIWSGVGRIVQDLGFERSVCQSLTWGRRDERRRVWYSWLFETGAIHDSAVRLAFT